MSWAVPGGARPARHGRFFTTARHQGRCHSLFGVAQFKGDVEEQESQGGHQDGQSWGIRGVG